MSRPRWVPAYVAIGSNLDDPAARVRAAFDALGSIENTRVVLRSPSYRTKPLGPADQPDFINAAAGLLTTLTPRELLTQLKALEQRLGRTEPVVRWGPRYIDLDLLMHGDARCEEPGLTLPHPGLTQRNFVLYPLRDIAPQVRVPGHDTVSTLAARVGSAGLAPL